MNEWSYYEHIDRVVDRFGVSNSIPVRRNEMESDALSRQEPRRPRMEERSSGAYRRRPATVR